MKFLLLTFLLISVAKADEFYCVYGDRLYSNTLTVDTDTKILSVSGHRESLSGPYVVYYSPFFTKYSLNYAQNFIELSLPTNNTTPSVCTNSGCQPCR